jgi:hypothetical protein
MFCSSSSVVDDDDADADVARSSLGNAEEKAVPETLGPSFLDGVSYLASRIPKAKERPTATTTSLYILSPSLLPQNGSPKPPIHTGSLLHINLIIHPIPRKGLVTECKRKPRRSATNHQRGMEELPGPHAAACQAH